MMQLPSETSPSYESAIIAIISTIGAGGLLKIYTQWQAGRTSIRAETATRIRTLEEQVHALQGELGNLREQKGKLEAEVGFLRASLALYQAAKT
jgi:hypothetical protein